jgi:hypothetical protein
MKIPEPEYNITALIDKHHESRQEPPRPHLGASTLGHSCDRWLWLSFRWAVQQTFDGRVLRMFRRGNLEEAQIVSDLRAIGIDIQRTTGNQSRVSFGSHVSGSLDGVIKSGVPGAPKTEHVAEFKTHGLKSFNDVEKKGVEESKPEHFVQMQTYMAGTNIDRALYVAVCKDDDRIYTERVKFDKDVAEKAIARGKRIALADRMPEPLSADPTWYQCKWCPAHDFCFESKITKHANCRTCAHSTALENSTWRCERHDADDIPVEWQREGCDSHVLHPDLVPYQRKESTNEWQAIYVINNKDVINGEPDTNVFGSKEILANPSVCANPDEFATEFRREFNARVVG